MGTLTDGSITVLTLPLLVLPVCIPRGPAKEGSGSTPCPGRCTVIFTSSPQGAHRLSPAGCTSIAGSAFVSQGRFVLGPGGLGCMQTWASSDRARGFPVSAPAAHCPWKALMDQGCFFFPLPDMPPRSRDKISYQVAAPQSSPLQTCSISFATSILRS